MNTLSKYYKGFYITEELGNNAFSYEKRTNKSIFVPPISEGHISGLELGTEIVFSEISEGEEHNKKGLKQFLHIKRRSKNIFIFDNHNHAFFFWAWGITTGNLKKGLPLVHVDTHSDLREPEEKFIFGPGGLPDLGKAFKYTNEVLNVGNFIKPALDLSIFSRFEKIDGICSMEKTFDEEIVLDLDIDIFAGDITEKDYDFKIKRILEYMGRSNFITIATSPYFIDQGEAIEIVKTLVSSCLH